MIVTNMATRTADDETTKKATRTSDDNHEDGDEDGR
jgi:hypothetical protein